MAVIKIDSWPLHFAYDKFKRFSFKQYVCILIRIRQLGQQMPIVRKNDLAWNMGLAIVLTNTDPVP